MKKLTKSELVAKVLNGEACEAFTHVELGSFNVTYTMMIAQREAERVILDINEEMLDIATNSRDWEQARVDALTPEELSQPILHLMLEDATGLLIDGTHRILRLHQDGITEVRSYLLPVQLAIRIHENEGEMITGQNWGTFAIINGKVVPHAA